MAFHITHRFGSMDGAYSIAAFPSLLEELNEHGGDDEHVSVSVTHESEWCLSAYGDGYIILEHLENGGERHMRGMSDNQIIQLWTLLADGDINAVERAPWTSGY